MEKLFHLGVKAIIQNAYGEVLVLKRAGREYWDVPGGRMQVGEQPLQTLAREVYEETGLLNLMNTASLAVALTPLTITLEDGAKVGLILWYHSCNVLEMNPHIMLSEEHSDFAWVSWAKAQELVSFFGVHIDLEPCIINDRTSGAKGQLSF